MQRDRFLVTVHRSWNGSRQRNTTSAVGGGAQGAVGAMESWRWPERHREAAGGSAVVDLPAPDASWRDRAVASNAGGAHVESRGAGRDFAGGGRKPLGVRDGPSAGPCAVDDQSRDSSPW